MKNWARYGLEMDSVADSIRPAPKFPDVNRFPVKIEERNPKKSH
jgi:hypothetical protein